MSPKAFILGMCIVPAALLLSAFMLSCSPH